MRPTLHDYVIKRFETILRIEHFATAFRQCYDFSKLTNRAPRLGDFVPCDEEGNVLEEPDSTMDYGISDSSVNDSDAYEYQSQCKAYVKAQDRVIFAGDWEVVETGFDTLTHHYLDSEYLGKSYNLTVISNGTHNIEFRDNDCGVWLSNKNHIGELQINRIEELPREIEFKDGVI